MFIARFILRSVFPPRFLLCNLLLCGGLVVAGRCAAAEEPAARFWDEELQPFLQTYCFDCHSGEGSEADIDFAQYESAELLSAERPRWNQVRGMIEIGAMPPVDYDPQPSRELREKMADWIDRQVNTVDCGVVHDPGRVTMRRLNSVEYDNTLRDLLGIDFAPSTLIGFPTDGVGNGFDNQGDVLTLSPLQLEKYLQAAQLVTSRVIVVDPESLRKQEQDMPEPHRRLFVARPSDEVSVESAAQQIFEPLMRRAFRRDPLSNEVARTIQLVKMAVDQGESFENAVGYGLQSILVSPHFLFRVENEGSGATDGLEALGDYALASRLSYFLWASQPDEQLLDLAGAAQLHDPEILQQQATRMLADPKAEALVSRFFGQLLGLGSLKESDPDPKQFPQWNDRLRDAVRRETELFCRELIAQDLPLEQLLQADFTFVNPRLAELYGIEFDGQDPAELYRRGPGPAGDRKGNQRQLDYLDEDRWLRVPLPPNRKGILTQASILTLTSNPTSTSPVKRGKWILESLLGDPPPPAPPNVPTLDETQKAHAELSLRQQLELHRANPSCASCHRVMDPLGLGFEHFDAIGQWRERDGKHPVDAAGELADGRKFSGSVELVGLLTSRQTEIYRHFAEQLLTYALGRGLEPYDNCAIDDIMAVAESQDYRPSAFVRAVVTSEPFSQRRATDDVERAQATSSATESE